MEISILFQEAEVRIRIQKRHRKGSRHVLPNKSREMSTWGPQLLKVSMGQRKHIKGKKL
jgi:hypothetical protein